MIFIENDLVTMCNYAGTCKGICKQNLVYNFLIQFLLLQSLVFAVHFSNGFWHRNKAFSKDSSYNEIVPLLIVFHLLYGKYRGVKICFHLCRYQNQNFSLVLHSCCSSSTRVTIVLLVSHSCLTCIANVALVTYVSGSRVVK